MALTASRNGAPPDSSLDAEPQTEQSLYEQFMELVPKTRSEMTRLEARRTTLVNQYQAERTMLKQRHEAQLAEVAGEKRKLLSLLKALGEGTPPTTKKRGPTKTRMTKGVSDRILLLVLEAIQQHTGGPFTTLGIYNALAGPATEASVYSAFSYLRTIEYIGKAGEENRPNGRTLWRILPNAEEIGERLKTSLTNPEIKAKPPSASVLQRTINAIKESGNEKFAALEVSEQMGQASPKGVYATFRFMLSVGYIKEAGRTPDRRDEDGARSRQLYVIDNEAALAEILDKEPTNA